MKPYPIRCDTPGCSRPAEYKIAARWSDGITQELKTFALVCTACIEKQFASAVVRRAGTRLAPGEVLEEPGVYDLQHGSRDAALNRRNDLEAGLNRGDSPLQPA
jgi:hypothetical protein